MAKLLIEIEALEDYMPIDLFLSAVATFLEDIANGEEVVKSYSATVTDDNGEIIRESE